MTVMAIFQDVDKCMRCNGCVVACKREWNLRAENLGVHTVSYETRVVVKSQKRADMGPFVRFSCWHCPDPPCKNGCPLGAITKQANGAVAVDKTKCFPNNSVATGGCLNAKGQRPCLVECQRGGYPEIGIPYVGSSTPSMNKCILCAGRAGSNADILAAGGTVAAALQTRATTAEIAAVAGKAHEPACVSSCPAKAMKWDTQANIIDYLNAPANGFIWADGSRNWIGNGSMFWGSTKTPLVPPKADPFIEDHVAPMIGSLLGSPVAKATLLPTLVIGGLMALSARRTNNEAASVTEGEV